MNGGLELAERDATQTRTLGVKGSLLLNGPAASVLTTNFNALIDPAQAGVRVTGNGNGEGNEEAHPISAAAATQ